eukprot:4001068-Pleurochrysis_carterae.AAC.2
MSLRQKHGHRFTPTSRDSVYQPLLQRCAAVTTSPLWHPRLARHSRFLDLRFRRLPGRRTSTRPQSR